MTQKDYLIHRIMRELIDSDHFEGSDDLEAGDNYIKEKESDLRNILKDFNVSLRRK